MDLHDALDTNLGFPGAMLSGSKSHYSDRHPENEVYFNACLFTEDDEQQVWWGDLDLTADGDRIQSAADDCERVLLVTPEIPFRFGGLRGKAGAMSNVTAEDRKRIRRFVPQAKDPPKRA